MSQAPLLQPGAPPRARPGRRVAVGVVLAPLLAAVLVAAGGGPAGAPPLWLALVATTAVVAATLLSGYVPARGQRLGDVLGCGPCDAVAGLSVVAAAALLSVAPHELTMAVAGLAVAVAGLVRRRGASTRACDSR